MGDLSTSLRALAHPTSVLALVVLVLNDHVLKEAWPGWVTGKLSDVAGLVVFPLLLAVPLAAVRVRRSLPVALAVAGGGFVFCKTSALGAAWTSSLWSLFGTPTHIRADVTDLLALPALWVAWRIHRTAAGAVAAGWRRTVAVAAGMAVLPVGVLATSATSCSESEGYQEVAVLEGAFPGPPTGLERRLAAGELLGARFVIDGTGAYREVDVELDGPLDRTRRTCVGERCWRLVGDGAVDGSTDGGRTWVREAELTDADRDAITDEVGTDEGCDDEPPAVGATDIAALETDGQVRVIVSLQRGGIWRRDPDGTWTVLTERELRDLIQRDRPPLPTVTEVDGSESPQPPGQGETPGPTVEPPSPACASPSQRTVTPNPLNGPPTTYEVCPTTPSPSSG